jgi:hypothetical protein
MGRKWARLTCIIFVFVACEFFCSDCGGVSILVVVVVVVVVLRGEGGMNESRRGLLVLRPAFKRK